MLEGLNIFWGIIHAGLAFHKMKRPLIDVHQSDFILVVIAIKEEKVLQTIVSEGFTDLVDDVSLHVPSLEDGIHQNVFVI